jgi:hypothetical protein
MPPSILIARWIEGEVIALKLLGLTFAQIATRIVAVVRGTQLPMTPLPLDITFPDNFKISPSACHKSLRRALNREPRAVADLLAQMLIHRSEDPPRAAQARHRSQPSDRREVHGAKARSAVPDLAQLPTKSR